MQEILIVAREFPPHAEVGYVVRAVKLCKYLPSFGFRPVVVTVHKNPRRTIDPARVPLLKEIAHGTDFHYVPENWFVRFVDTLSSRKKKLKRIRKRSLKYFLLYVEYILLSGVVKNIFHVVKKWLILPDEGVLWNRKAARVCRELIQTRDIRYLFTTSPPNSVHRLGVELKRHFDLTWCADFRDAWVGNPMFTRESSYRNAREREQERRVLAAADVITSVNDPIVNLLRSHLGESTSKSFATVYNGFDPEGMDVPAASFDRHCINMIHCGVLFQDRNMGPFLSVATEMVQQGKPFRIYLVGRVHDRNCYEFHAQYPDVVYLMGTASHQKTISMIKGADVTILIQSSRYFAGLSGKIFEYLWCDKRVIGLVPEGIAREFIREFNMGWSCDLEDTARIRAILEEVYLLWRSGTIGIRYPEEVKKRFDRRGAAEKIARLMLEHRGAHEL